MELTIDERKGEAIDITAWRKNKTANHKIHDMNYNGRRHLFIGGELDEYGEEVEGYLIHIIIY